MVAIRGRTFKRPWRRSCLSSKLKSSSAPIGREDSWCFHAVGSSNAPLLGSTVVEGSQRIGRTSIATRWRSCGLPQSASCSENFVIPPDVFGQTLRISEVAVCCSSASASFIPRSSRDLRLRPTRTLAFVPVERSLRPRVGLFAPLRDKVTSSAQSLVLPFGRPSQGWSLSILTEPHGELAAPCRTRKEHTEG